MIGVLGLADNYDTSDHQTLGVKGYLTVEYFFYYLIAEIIPSFLLLFAFQTLFSTAQAQLDAARLSPPQSPSLSHSTSAIGTPLLTAQLEPAASLQAGGPPLAV